MSITVNEEKCTRCSVCAEVCPIDLISAEDGLPFMPVANEAFCMSCQHCVMACHSGALSVNGIAAGEKTEDLSEDGLNRLIRSRRSVREYKQENVDKTLLEKVINLAHQAPTGHNDGDVLFTVIDDMAQMDKLKEMVKGVLRKCIDQKMLPAGAEFLYGMFEEFLSGNDMVFRDAPHLVITSVPSANMTSDVDAAIAISYFDLIAHANGIGTCWNGLTKFILDVLAPDIRLALGIPQDHVTGYAMTFGYPDVAYITVPDRGTANISRVSL